MLSEWEQMILLEKGTTPVQIVAVMSDTLCFQLRGQRNRVPISALVCCGTRAGVVEKAEL